MQFLEAADTGYDVNRSFCRRSLGIKDTYCAGHARRPIDQGLHSIIS